jgi:hypothetical protein
MSTSPSETEQANIALLAELVAVLGEPAEVHPERARGRCGHASGRRPRAHHPPG